MGRIALTPSKDLEGTDEQRIDLRVRPRRVKRVEFPTYAGPANPGTWCERQGQLGRTAFYLR